MLQIRGHRNLPATARIAAGTVTAGAHIAEANRLCRHRALQERLHPAIVLHPVRQTIAENGDGIAFRESERKRVAVIRRHICERGLLRLISFLALCRLLSACRRLARLSCEGEIRELPAFLHIDLHRFRGRYIRCSEDLFAVCIEERDCETIEPAREFTAIPNTDLLDVLGLPEIQLPPRQCHSLVSGVRLPLLVVVRILVAIDRPRRHSVAIRAGLCRFTARRDILPVADDLHLRKREDAFVAGQFDADKTRLLPRDQRRCRLRALRALVALRAVLLVLLLLRRLRRVVVRRDRALESRIHLRLDAPRIRAASEGVRLRSAEECDVQVRLDRVLHAQRP